MSAARAARTRTNGRRTSGRRPVVIKFGGELLETADATAAAARIVARTAAETPVVVVHGGGREIDAALAAAGIPKRQVDGLRVTDAATLQVVVAVLAGTINTRFVAAINAAGARAVGLTGADADVAITTAARPHRATSGEVVDLGLVGTPRTGRGATLVELLAERGYVPVVASLGADRRGRLYNVNADTLAGHLAAALRASRLVIAGGTAGVLDAGGATIPSLDAAAVKALVRAGTASAGMIAKLAACRAARRGGVDDVIIAAGRDPKIAALAAGTAPARGAWTRLL